MTDQPARQVSIAEAASALGISEHAIRRRIKAGDLTAERVERPQGYTYLVTLPPNGHVASDGATSQPASDGAGATSQVAPRRASRQEPDSAAILRALELVAAKDAEIAAERERGARLEQERAELYGRLGYFQAQLELAQERIRLLEAPKEAPPPVEPEPMKVDPPQRPWWRIWR